jgi:Mn2+/Fe2+ NRAMP family transporter
MPKNSLLTKLGPGLLYAGAAIGVSHLVQSTRAGASFGITMILVVVLANFFKYPFFQYGPRYVAATGKSLLHGYKKLGSWAIWTFFLLTIGTMFIIQGAITVVTAGLASYILGSELAIVYWVIIILSLSFILLVSDQLQLLNKFMKVVMVILAVTTIAAAISSIFTSGNHLELSSPLSFQNSEHIFFLIAFIGWMPAPIDISVWYSVWSEENAKISPHSNDLKSSLFDFSVGYWGTAVLALCFVILGTFMLHQSGIELSSNAVVFSGQIINAYTNSLGKWATSIISIAAFTTMFSTTISVLDGISRVMSPTFTYLKNSPHQSSSQNSYRIWLIVLIIGAFITIWKFGDNMKNLVDFATSISFLTAPILAYLNIRVMQSNDVPTSHQPSKFTKSVSYIGLGLLILFSIIYIYFRLKV